MKRLILFTVTTLLILGAIVHQLKGPAQAQMLEARRPVERTAPIISSAPEARPALPKAPKVAQTASEKLRDALAIQAKVLPSKADIEALHQAWSNDELLGLSAGRLLHVSEVDATPEAQDLRIQAIDFLDGAALWEKNPRRQQAIQSIQAVLAREIETLELPLELKRSLAGDVIELYAVLLQADEGLAGDLYQTASQAQRNLFDFGKNMLGQVGPKQNGEKQS